MDFLDILEGAERKDFESPPPLMTTLQEQSAPIPTPEEQQPQNALDDEEVTDDVDDEICRNPDEGKGAVLPLEKIDSQVLDPVQDDEEHPHFALVTYLADLASVRDPVPEGLHPIEEEVTNGSIEDILTAAALAESFQDEIFITEDVQVPVFQPDEEDVAVDIMTATEDTVDERSEAPTELSRVIQNQETPVGSPRPTSASVDDAVEEFVQINPVDNGLIIDEPAEMEDDDSESLISYSEAEVTVETATLEDIQHVNDPLAHSVTVAIDNFVQITSEEAEMTALPNFVASADTVGIDETGQFTAPAIHILEDQVPSDNLPMLRQSLDHSVLFSVSTEQIIFPSPPKRQLSICHEDNVAPSPFFR